MTVFYDARQIPFSQALRERARRHQQAAEVQSDLVTADVAAWHWEQAKLALDLAGVVGNAIPLDPRTRWPR